MKWETSICVLGMLAVFAAASYAPIYAQAPGIAGSWALNQDESDSLDEVMGPREPGIRRAQTPRGAQRGTRGGDGRGGSAELSDEQRQVGQAMMRLFSEGGQRLVIAETDSTVTVVGGASRTVYYVDEREVEATVSGGVVVEIKAKWDKATLKVETKAPGNVKITQEFELDEDSGRLNVKTMLSNSRMEQNFTLERVYDPAT